MGSLTSRPDIPQVKSPVVITVPSVTPVIDSPQSSGTGGEAPAQTDEAIKAKAREDSLLSRSRGGFSMILTGLGGILSDAAASPVRKTLLGE